MSEINQTLHILDIKSFEACKKSKYGCNPENRLIDEYIDLGILNLDKHAGPTSHEIVSIVKEILQIDKAGHSGTLDPGVTGVLPIGLLRATKILSNLLDSRKEYICNMRLQNEMDVKTLRGFLTEFEDEIYQVPPLKSNVVKKLRRRIVYELELIEVLNKEVLFRVSCQAGTYIRTLCEDLGRAMGNRAYMKELRRTKIGSFAESNLVTLHALFDAVSEYQESGNDQKLKELILPVEKVIGGIPKIYVKDHAVDPLCHGSSLAIPGVVAFNQFFVNQKVALMTCKDELIALGEAAQSSNSLGMDVRGIIASPKSVFMERDRYPQYVKK